MQELSAVDQQLYYLAPSGVGLILIGALNLLFARESRLLRGSLSATAIALVFGFMATIEMPARNYGYAVGVFALGLSCVVLLRASLFSRVASFARKPATAWCVLALLGLGTTVGTVVRHDLAMDHAINEEMTDLDAISHIPERKFLDAVYVTTDRGYVVPVSVALKPHDKEELDNLEIKCSASIRWLDQVIKLHPANENTNCHGWVFTGGRYMIGGNDVPKILHDNHYLPVETPEPGDVVIYRDHDKVSHTAIVRYVTPKQPVMVESKWGWLGVYLHAIDHSGYGTDYTFYRTDRGNDLLKGIVTSATPVTASAEPQPRIED